MTETRDVDIYSSLIKQESNRILATIDHANMMKILIVGVMSAYLCAATKENIFTISDEIFQIVGYTRIKGTVMKIV